VPVILSRETGFSGFYSILQGNCTRVMMVLGNCQDNFKGKRQCCGTGSGGSLINWPPGSGSGSKHSESGIWIRFRFRFRIPTIYQRLFKNLRKNGVQYFFNYNDLQHVMTTNVFSEGTKMSR
jgi:hypothetical protein